MKLLVIVIPLIIAIIYSFMPEYREHPASCMYKNCPVEKLVSYCYMKHNFTRTYEDAKMIGLEHNTERLIYINSVSMAHCVHTNRNSCYKMCSNNGQKWVNMHLVRNIITPFDDQALYNKSEFIELFKLSQNSIVIKP